MSDTQKHNKPNVPNLRFPGFSEEWEKHRIGELCSFFSGGTPSSSKKEYYGGKISFIRSGEIHSDDTELFLSEEGYKNSSAKMVEVGDILLALYGANSGDIAISKIHGAINQAILCIRTNMVSVFFKSVWEKHTQKILDTYLQGGQGNLSAEIVKKIFIHLPAYDEQLKLAAFISKLEERIAIQNKVIEDLKSLYDVICQKLYSPNDKLGWQEFKYSDIFTISNERNSRLQYTNVLSASQEYGMIERGELNIDIKFDAASIKNYKIVRPNEYVIHLRSFQGGFAYSDKTGICSPAYTILLPNERLIPSFLKYYFTSIRFINSLRIVTYGIRDGRSISVEEFLQLKIAIPSIPEQHHIVNAMQLWEDMIRIEECHLSNLQKQKQYLLRQMFI